MPGTPKAASHWPQLELAKIMLSATIKSKPLPRTRGVMLTRSSPVGVSPGAISVKPGCSSLNW